MSRFTKFSCFKFFYFKFSRLFSLSTLIAILSIAVAPALVTPEQVPAQAAKSTAIAQSKTIRTAISQLK
ncbi:hypothetical protein [Romeriopsis navalis]|uniref:hypothetical protein n=1 Tax=Romeriopsis navalis TaxID=2992132 RepID=UPI0021F84496|nr:hypothetical protein [Romeriopsis navalis]